MAPEVEGLVRVVFCRTACGPGSVEIGHSAQARVGPEAELLRGNGAACGYRRRCQTDGVGRALPPYSKTDGSGYGIRKQMVLDTVSLTVETRVESQLSTTVSEGNL
jgi:hypothetical protein